VRSKWCRPDTLWERGDVKWYVGWYRPCHERWGFYDGIYIHDRIVERSVGWYGMVDGRVVHFFWKCQPEEYPDLMCVELDNEGIGVLLRNLEKDRPAKVYCSGELPPELLAICQAYTR